MRNVKVKNLTIGQGKPKVIVPIVGNTHSDILNSAERMNFSKIDLVEWRVDFYENVLDFQALKKTLEDLRKIIKNTPLLFTFRTKKEGGEQDISMEKYLELNIEAARSGMVDLVDVEIMSGDEVVERLISAIHNFDVKVIASNHDFHKTPPKEDLIFRLNKMQDMKADILKIAVMPQSKEDVLELLSVTNLMNLNYAEKPIVTMAMGSLGVVTRLVGEVFGSSMTFGAVGQTSAPGQIPVDELDDVLRIIHKAII